MSKGLRRKMTPEEIAEFNSDGREELPIEVRLGNFKAFASEQRIPIKPITLVYGANSAGKSSILQSILLMKQSAGQTEQCPLVFNGDSIDLASLKNVIYSHNCTAPLIMYPVYKEKYYQIKTYLYDSNNDTLTCKTDLIYDGECLIKGGKLVPEHSKLIARFNRITSNLDEINKNISKAYGLIKEGFKCVSGYYRRIIETCVEESLDISDYVTKYYNSLNYDDFIRYISKDLQSDNSPFDDENSIYDILERLLGEPYGADDVDVDEDGNPYLTRPSFIRHKYSSTTAIIRRIIDESNAASWRNVQYIGPLRHTPERYYQKNINFKDSVGLKGEHLAEMLYADKVRLTKLNTWFKRLGINYKAKVHKPRDPDIDLYVMKLTDGNGVYVSPADVGFGVSQIMPIIAQTVSSKNKMILIEQPEIHLHPKLQAEMADLFIESAKGPDKNTFMLETHSEHLMLRILRRIRETTTGELTNKRVNPSIALTPDDVSVLYVQSGKDGSQVIQIPITSDGRFEIPWPEGFFAERAKELFSR